MLQQEKPDDYAIAGEIAERQVENGCFHNYKALDSNLVHLLKWKKL